MKFDAFSYNFKEFYVDPETQELCQVLVTYNAHQTKGMNSEELRAFRENEKKAKLAHKREKRNSQMTDEAFQEVIKKAES